MIDVKQLERGSTILLETLETVYEIKVSGPKTGVVKITGGKRFVYSTRARLRGCVDKTPNKETSFNGLTIEKNKGLEITYKDDAGSHDFITAKVLSARVTGPKGDWYYDVIEKKESELEDSNTTRN